MKSPKISALAAKQVQILAAIESGHTTSEGIIVPNKAAIHEFGTPTGMDPSPGDAAFGFVVFKHKRDQQIRFPVVKRP